MQKALNPETGQLALLIDGQWQIVEHEARNNRGQLAYYAGGQWHIDDEQDKQLPSFAPAPTPAPAQGASPAPAIQRPQTERERLGLYDPLASITRPITREEVMQPRRVAGGYVPTSTRSDILAFDAAANFFASSPAGDILRGVTGGAEQLVRAARTAARAGDNQTALRIGQQALDTLRQFRQNRALAPQDEAYMNQAERFLSTGIEQVAQSVTMAAPGIAAGAAVGGGVPGAVVGFVGGGASIAGLAKYDEFMSEVEAYNASVPPKQRLDIDNAQRQALYNAVVEGGLEGLSNAIDALTLRASGTLARAAMAGLKRKVLSQAVELTGTTVGNVGTEMAQEAASNVLQQRAGLPTQQTPMQAAMAAVEPALATQLVVTLLGMPGGMRRYRASLPPTEIQRLQERTAAVGADQALTESIQRNAHIAQQVVAEHQQQVAPASTPAPAQAQAQAPAAQPQTQVQTQTPVAQTQAQVQTPVAQTQVQERVQEAQRETPAPPAYTPEQVSALERLRKRDPILAEGIENASEAEAYALRQIAEQNGNADAIAAIDARLAQLEQANAPVETPQQEVAPIETPQQSAAAIEEEIPSIEVAREWYANNQVPDGWFVHGRSPFIKNGKKIKNQLRDDVPILMSRDIEVMDSYGRNGSRWYIRPKKTAVILDLTNEENMRKIVDAAIRDYEEGESRFRRIALDIEAAHGEINDEIIEDSIRKSFNPQNIVNSAEAYDDTAWGNWLYEVSEADFIVTQDGAIALSNDEIDAINIDAQSPRSSQRGAALVGMGIPQLVDRVVRSQTVQETRSAMTELGKRVYEAGARTWRAWHDRMRALLGRVWAKVSPLMRSVWNDIRAFYGDERGMAGTGRKTALTPEQQARVDELAKRLKYLRGQEERARRLAPITEPRADMPANIRTELQQEYDRVEEGRAIQAAETRTQDDYKRYKIGVIGRALIPVSSIMRRISPRLWSRLNRFERDSLVNIARQQKRIVPFLSAMRNLPKGERAVLDLALKNGDAAMVQQIVDANNMTEAFAEYRATMNDLYQQAVDQGFDVGFLEDFSPRLIRNVDALIAAIGTTEAHGIITREINRAIDQHGQLTDEEKAEIVNRVLRGFGRSRVLLNAPGQIKERSVPIITAELNQYYADTETAALKYIEKVVEAIEARKFFGRSAAFAEGAALNLGQSIGNLALELIERGEMNAAAQELLAEVLQARFGYRATPRGVATWKQANYLCSISQIASTITQLQDFVYSVYSAGPIHTIRALVDSSLKKSEVSVADLGIERPWEELGERGALSHVLDKSLRIIVFNWMDRVGKETLVNATLAKLRQQARNHSFDAKADRLLSETFGDERAQVEADLREGRRTEDVELLLFTLLANFHPVTKSEMPLAYINNPRGRLFYQLKTYTVKQIDNFRREAFELIEQGKYKEGLTNIAYLAFLLMLGGMGTDELKDWVLGRSNTIIDRKHGVNVDAIHDRVIDNIIRLTGLSRYMVQELRHESPISVLLKLVAPPAPLVERPVRDLMKLWPTDNKGLPERWREFRIRNLETAQNIPVLGKPYYWWWGGGAEREKKAEEKRRRGGA